MKRILALVLALTLITAAFSACTKTPASSGTTSATSSGTTVIKVGASVTPHAEILKVAKEILAKEGYDLEIVTYNDYVLPNTATESGELDANYFQHQPYLTDFNQKHGTHLVSVAAVHYEPFGIYAGKTKALKDLADGATIAIPNDGTNEARALYLLQAQGLITLKDNAGFTATILDIKDNPKKLKIKEIEAAQLARSLTDVDLAIINGNYALEAGLKVSDALAVEAKDSTSAKTYANILVVKEGNESKPGIVALKKALLSDTVKEYINKTFGGAVVPIF